MYNQSELVELENIIFEEMEFLRKSVNDERLLNNLDFALHQYKELFSKSNRMYSNFKDISHNTDIGIDDNKQKPYFNEIIINDVNTGNLSSIFVDFKFNEKLSSDGKNIGDENNNNDESKTIVAKLVNELIQDLKLK